MKVKNAGEDAPIVLQEGVHYYQTSMFSTGADVVVPAKKFSNVIFNDVQGLEASAVSNAQFSTSSPVRFFLNFATGEQGAESNILQESDYNKYVKSSEKIPAQARANIDLSEYLRVFIRTARSDTIEYGTVSKCDELLARWFSESPLELGMVINHIFLQSLKDKNLLLFLLKAISNLPYVDIYPFGQTVALAALVNVDVEVIEAGIRAFENWGDRSAISALESSKLAHDWLELYREQTVTYLREI